MMIKMEKIPVHFQNEKKIPEARDLRNSRHKFLARFDDQNFLSMKIISNSKNGINMS